MKYFQASLGLNVGVECRCSRSRLAGATSWRNKRRTWLTAGGIAFAIVLVVFSMAMQFGSYEGMTENATSLLTGHLQIQNPAYVDNQRIEYTIAEATALRRQIELTPGVVAVAPRVEAFALASVGERSSGVQILGVDVAAEQRTVRFFKFVKQGRPIQAADDAVLGLALARNLGLGVGDELVLLGAAKEGGIAALALKVVRHIRIRHGGVGPRIVACPDRDRSECF